MAEHNARRLSASMEGVTVTALQVTAVMLEA